MITSDSYSCTKACVERAINRNFPNRFSNLYGGHVESEGQLKRHFSRTEQRPEVMVYWNFCPDRAAMTSLCRDHGVNVLYGEDGFFPHYETIHIDPLGFCWESSLTRMIFRECTDAQRRTSRRARMEWVEAIPSELPPAIKPPYVLWPLQKICDAVNHHDLHLSSWGSLVRHFRGVLPMEYQLVLRPHPGGSLADLSGLDSLLKELPNTILLGSDVKLSSLIQQSHAVAGANSSVLLEARLMFLKPTYTYARSWYTNHEDLFPTLRPQQWEPKSRPLPRIDWLEDPRSMLTERLMAYTDWFLYQLLARQLPKRWRHGANAFKEQVMRLSYLSYLKYGDSIFDDVASEPPGQT